MRAASSDSLQALLRRFGSGLVVPLLDAASAGAESDAPHIRRLLSARIRGVRVVDAGQRAFWRRSGALVLDEYRRWTAWLHSLTLSDLVPPSSQSAAPQVRHIFCNVLYGAALNDRDIWMSLVGEPYDRRALCRLFLEEVGYSACPYCDIDSIRGAFHFEHFIPRSKVPYLAVAPQNLYVACSACNSPQIGKGDRTRLPATRPDLDNKGDLIRFRFHKSTIGLVCPPRAASANVVALLKLEARYGEAVLYQDVMTAARHAYEAAIRASSSVSLRELLRYHRAAYWREPLFFARRAALIEAYARDVT